MLLRQASIGTALILGALIMVTGCATGITHTISLGVEHWPTESHTDGATLKEVGFGAGADLSVSLEAGRWSAMELCVMGGYFASESESADHVAGYDLEKSVIIVPVSFCTAVESSEGHAVIDEAKGPHD